jgi:hypothetical protein
MATAYITGLVIYDSRLFDRNSHVSRWAHSVSSKFTGHAIAKAPVNKRQNKSPWYSAYPVGALKASISGDAYRVGPKHWQITLDVNVPYAGWVLGGTTGPITPTASKYMQIPYNSGFGRRQRHYVVSGQKANNFLAEAAAATARSHPSVRGLPGHLFEQW